MARLTSIQQTNVLIEKTVDKLKETTASEIPFTPFKAVKVFSRRQLSELDRVLSAIDLPGAVVIYDGSSYYRGRPPARVLRLAVVAKPLQKSTPEETAEMARDQLDALIQHVDEYTYENATWLVQSDMVVEGKNNAIYYAATFEVWDH